MTNTRPTIHRSSIILRKDIYNKLAEKKVFEKKQFSDLVNKLLFEYLDNDSINALDKRNKNFINATIERSLKEQLKLLNDKLDAIYMAANYQADKSRIDNEFQKELLDILNNDVFEFNNGSRKHEFYLKENVETFKKVEEISNFDDYNEYISFDTETNSNDSIEDKILNDSDEIIRSADDAIYNDELYNELVEDAKSINNKLTIDDSLNEQDEYDIDHEDDFEDDIENGIFEQSFNDTDSFDDVNDLKWITEDDDFDDEYDDFSDIEENDLAELEKPIIDTDNSDDFNESSIVSNKTIEEVSENNSSVSADSSEKKKDFSSIFNFD